MPGGIPKEIVAGTSKAILYEKPEGVVKAISQLRTLERILSRFSKADVPVEISGEFTEGILGGISREISAGSSAAIAGRIIEEILGRITREIPGGIPEKSRDNSSKEYQ